MVFSTRSHIYNADSRRIEAPTLVPAPASPPAAAIVAAPVVEHHSTNKKRDRRGRFINGNRTSNAHQRRSRTMMTNPRRTQEEDEEMMPVEAKCDEGKQVVVPAPVDEIPQHGFVFVCNPKVSVHCTFSHDSDEETEEWSIPSKRELKQKAERIRVLLKRKYFR